MIFIFIDFFSLMWPYSHTEQWKETLQFCEILHLTPLFQVFPSQYMTPYIEEKPLIKRSLISNHCPINSITSIVGGAEYSPHSLILLKDYLNTTSLNLNKTWTQVQQLCGNVGCILQYRPKLKSPPPTPMGHHGLNFPIPGIIESWNGHTYSMYHIL